MATVRIVEVSPRDGLQNITKIVPTQVKIELINRLRETGLLCIEATSFVSPKWIPQLADSQQVMSAIKPLIKEGSVRYPVLVPNLKGLEAAILVEATEVAVFVSATESFSKRNINCTVVEGLDQARKVTKKALAKNLRVRAYVSCIFADPDEGPTNPEQVLHVVKQLLDMGCYEVSLGDTLGVGTPLQVRRLLDCLLKVVPVSRLAGHFHDTYGQAVANALAAYELGVRVFDTSVSGLGGCPYSPGAKGNLASEDLIYAFHAMGVETGVNLKKLVEVGNWISKKLDQPNGSRAGAALSSRLIKLQPNSLASRTPETFKRTWNTINNTSEYQILRHKSSVQIILNRPSHGNTLTVKMLESLTLFIQQTSRDRTIAHIIITGSGKFFCTGMDLSHGGATTQKASQEEKNDQFYKLWKLFEVIEDAPQTTIALINGPSFGGGVGLAFACDIRLAASEATFTLSEGKLGLSPAVISRYIFREWGIAFAREAILTARPISPVELHRKIGAVHGICRRDDLESLLNTRLDQLVKIAPGASSMSKDLARAAWRHAGDATQTSIIKSVYDTMMKPSDEASYGLDQFRSKKRDINWEDFHVDQVSAKL